MKEYKVWISIEEIDEEHDVWETVDEPMGLGTFKTFKEADRFRSRVYDEVEGTG